MTGFAQFVGFTCLVVTGPGAVETTAAPLAGRKTGCAIVFHDNGIGIFGGQVASPLDRGRLSRVLPQ